MKSSSTFEQVIILSCNSCTSLMIKREDEPRPTNKKEEVNRLWNYNCFIGIPSKSQYVTLDKDFS